MEKIKIACYCRVSTKNENQQSSIENQQAFFTEFVERNPQYELYNIYADEGISGKSIKRRAAFQQMIQDAKTGCFQKILVKDISRLARNVVDLLETVRELRKYNVAVDFVTYNMETMGNSEFVLTILAAIAQEESHNTSIKVKFGKKQSAKKGEVPSCVYGYDSIGNKSYSLKINMQEAKTVKDIFYMFSEKQYGVLKIANVLNERKIPTKLCSQNGWTGTTIRRILNNPLYLGRVCNGKTETKDFLTGSFLERDEKDWIIVSKPELRIISDEMFQKAREIRTHRCALMKSREKICPSTKHPLSNLLYCSCGSSYRRKIKKNTNTAYWCCTRRDKYTVKACSNKTFVDEEQMHNAIKQFLRDITGDGALCKPLFLKKFRQTLKDELLREGERTILETEKNALIKRRKKIMALYLEDRLEKEYLEAEAEPIEARLREITGRLSAYSGKDYVEDQINTAFELLLQEIENNSSDLLNNILLKSIFHKFIVYSDGRITAILEETDNNKADEIPFAFI